MGVRFSLSENASEWLCWVAITAVWLYAVPGSLLWNCSVARYTLRHSFDLHFILFNQVVMSICVWVFWITQKVSAFHHTFWSAVSLFALWATFFSFNLEAIPSSHRAKQLWTMWTVFVPCQIFFKTLYNRTDNNYNGIEVHIESLDVTISLRAILLMSVFNSAIFWFKKLILMTKYPNCILVATYPRVIWMNSGMRQQTLSSFGRRRTRAASISLDIYKQSMVQGMDIFLFEDDSVAHKLCNPETAEQLHRIHFSKHSLIGIIIAAAATLFAIPLSINILAIVSETCCIIILLVGPFTFDVEMMKAYLKSFDFWYKWFNWTMYLRAYSIWTNRLYDMDGLAWTEFALRNFAITLTMLYIFAVDAYHAPERNKKRALFILILVAMYFYVCIVSRLHFLHPSERWEDWEIELPLMQVDVSLRGMMMSSMGNFIIFMVKQLVVMALHPGVAAFQLYPKITWIGEEEEDQVRPSLEET